MLYYDPAYYANLDSEYLADDMSEFMTSRAFADEVHRELATGSTPIDEARVLEQADKVMAQEREVKKMQLSMLVRIRNLLTPEQIAKLQEIRRRTS